MNPSKLLSHNFLPLTPTESGLFPFDKILVADRGEIALRVIRACKELGIRTVAVYSEADTNSLHVGLADEDVCIGPPPGDQSYQNVTRILSAAEVTNADAIHPGYGPLAENAEFAEICRACGITFIGPSTESIRLMGDKATARRTMMEAGLPLSSGTGLISDLDEARAAAPGIGYPLRLKAVAGGGGRGMRTVRSADELEKAWQIAKAEAGAAFVTDGLYLEKEIEGARHVEFQIMGDQEGNVAHLGERECSVQRRAQKLIEESPSPAVNEDLRQRMGEDAVRAARSVGYSSVGTVEFLLDQEKNYFFMEMNTRIQVEHPITEIRTGFDLVKAQIQIAAGQSMGKVYSAFAPVGHAIECRINAEDPERNFQPTPGKITAFHIPGGPGIRVDTHVYAGYEVPSEYDSLLAKLIAAGRTREETIARVLRALEEFVIEGVSTTIPFHLKALCHPDFQAGRITTDFVERLDLPM